MKKFLGFFFVFALMLSMCACDAVEDVLDVPAKEKTFTVENMTITLNDDFFRLDRLAQEQDFCISSEDIVIFGLKVDREETSMTVQEYAAAFREVMNEPTMSEIRQLDGNPVMQYESPDDEGEMRIIYIVIYPTDECFWLLQFISEKDDFAENQPLIEQYAKSVKFS